MLYEVFWRLEDKPSALVGAIHAQSHLEAAQLAIEGLSDFGRQCGRNEKNGLWELFVRFSQSQPTGTKIDNAAMHAINVEHISEYRGTPQYKR